MSDGLIDVLLVSADADFRDLVARHRGPVGVLRCAANDEAMRLGDTRVRQLWVDLDTTCVSSFPPGARVVYFYSTGRTLPAALPPGLFVRKPCAAVLLEALWADLASRSVRRTPNDGSPSTAAALPGWLIEYLDLGLAPLCRRLVTTLASRLGYRHASVYLLDPDGRVLTLYDTSHARPIERHIELDGVQSHPMASVAQQGRYLRTERARDEWTARQILRPAPYSYADGACLIVPLVADGRLLGMLNLCERARPLLGEREEPLPAIFAFLGRVVHHARQFEQARAEARVDSLTGLFNQRWMCETLGREIRRSERFGTPLAVLLVDLDGMKRVNDQHGHAAGDAILQQVGRRIAGVLRQFDGAARVGGDEFLVLLPATNLPGAEQVASRILEAIREAAARVRDDLDVRITASIGAAEWRPGLDAAQLADAADQAMYRAKHAGGDRIVLCESQRSES